MTKDSQTGNDRDLLVEVHQRIIRTALMLAVSPALLSGLLVMLHLLSPRPVSGPEIKILAYVIFGLGVLLAPLTLAIRSRILNVTRMTAVALYEGPRVSDPPPGVSGEEVVLARRLVLGHLLPMLIAEGIGVIGLIVYVISGDFLMGIILAGGSFFLMLPHLPRKKVFVDLKLKLNYTLSELKKKELEPKKKKPRKK